MASPIDELIIRIKADTKQLQSELKKVEGKIRVTGAAGGAAFGMGAAGLGGKLKALAGPVAIGAVVLGFGKLATMSATVGSQFEDLKDSLDQVFGSMAAGDAAMDKVFKFAQTTPFQIEDATKAFTFYYCRSLNSLKKLDQFLNWIFNRRVNLDISNYFVEH
jgi:phage tail tape-measure protein